ncbi:MAG TPA: DUF6502 family protein [Steroidobacteraceae bacterium]|nr:DUF6502 family protein [Steroidobacteraceae bacterium]
MSITKIVDVCPMEAVRKTSSDEREALLALFTGLLRPLMPVALERGISAREISDSVRRAYVQELEKRMTEQDRRLSDARLALVAGLTRSEVQLFRDPSRKSVTTTDDKVSNFQMIARLLTVWHTHPKFSGAYGLALDLALDPSLDPGRRSFAELVEAANPGANPDSLLDELIATKSAEIVDNTTLRCRSRAAIWNGVDDVNVKQIDRAAKCLEAAASSFAHNLLQDETGEVYFERMVISNHPLSERSRNEFLAVAQARGEGYVSDLDSWIARHTEPDESPTSRHYGVGVYFFDEPPSRENSRDGQKQSGDLSVNRRNGSVREIDVLAPPASMKRDEGKSGN